MKKSLLTVVLCVAGFFTSYATVFISIGTGNWSNPGVWSGPGDGDGVPDSDDDVTIDVGHTITVTGTTANCASLIVEGTISVNSGAPLYIRGDYTVNGTESGTGGIGFITANAGTISGTGTFGTGVRYSFSANNKTIAAGIVLNKQNVNTSIASATTVTILGTLRVGNVTNGTNGIFLVGATGTFEMRKSVATTSTWRINASTSGSTVIYAYANASSIMKNSIGSVFHHLTISGATTKSLPATITVNGDLTLSAGTLFNFNGFNLNVKGDIICSTTSYTQTAASTLTLNGTAAQDITFPAGAVTVPNLVINNAAGVNVISGNIRISNVLTVTSGNFDAGSSDVTLVSDASATARIEQVTGTISGDMIIQRFIDTRSDGFSDVSSPISGATFDELNDDFELIFCPYIEFVSSPSAWGYNETLWDYVAIETSGTAMTSGTGYEVYLDSDGDTTTTFSATTVDFVGTPNFGDVPVTVTVDNDGWNLIGNPYASFIDFTTFKNNSGLTMSSTFMYYDETIEDFNTGTDGDDLATGQGFWIQATFAGTATFHENNKTTSTSSTFRSAKEELFSLRVKSDLIRFTSNTYFRFNEESGAVYEDGKDLTFLKVPAPTAPSMYSMSADGRKLRINELEAADELSIPVHFKAAVDGEYSISLLNLEMAQFEGYTEILLEDKKTGIFYDITTSDYHFDGASNDGEERFVLHLRKSTASPMAVENTNVTFTNSAEGVFAHFNFTESTDAYITVFNVSGQEITATKYVNASANREKVELPDSYQGIYIVRVMTGDKIYTQRFYKN